MQTKKNLFTALGFLLALNLFCASTASAQCRDPWVSQAVKQVYGRSAVGQGEVCECSIKLYNNGSWGSYNELVGYVQQVLNSGLQLGYAMASNGNPVVIARQNGVMGVSMLNGSGQVIAIGGGNVITAGGGNVITAGGANVVTSGGANFQGLNANTPGFMFGSGRQTLAAGQTRLNTSGSGSLVITR